MEQEFFRTRERKSIIPGLVVILALVLVAVFAVFSIFYSNRKIISPLPQEPDFEVIFQTPVPSVTEAPSTPSATPRIRTTSIPTKAPVSSPSPKA